MTPTKPDREAIRNHAIAARQRELSEENARLRNLEPLKELDERYAQIDELRREVERWKGHHDTLVEKKNRLSEMYGEKCQQLAAAQAEIAELKAVSRHEG